MNAVKQWNCECKIMWHACSKHKFAKAHVTQASKQAKTARSQPSPANEPMERRRKVAKPATTIDQFVAEIYERQNGKGKEKTIPVESYLLEVLSVKK